MMKCTHHKQFGRYGFGLMLVALLLFFAWPQDAKAADVEVSTYPELVAALSGSHTGTNIVITKDIKADGLVANETQKDGTFTDQGVIRISGTCSIDLRGHTIDTEISPESDKSFLIIDDTGDVVIKNGTLKTRGDGIAPLSVFGTVTLSDVTLEGTREALLGWMNAKITIQSGTFKSSDVSAVTSLGEIIVEDGLFDGINSGLLILYSNRSTLKGGTYIGNYAGAIKIKSSPLKIQDIIAADKALELDGKIVKNLDVKKLEGKKAVIHPPYTLTVGEHLQLTTAVGPQVLPGEKLGVQVVNLPFNQVVKQIFLNHMDITDEKDKNGVHYFEMPFEDSTLSVKLRTKESGPEPAPNPEPQPSPAGPLLTTVFKIDDKRIEVDHNGTKNAVDMDVAPYIKNGRTMLPVRFVGQCLNMKVDFDNKTRDVTVKGAKRSITLNLDSNQAIVDGKSYTLESKPENVAGRTMLPIGEIADLLGLSRAPAPDPAGNLHWDGNARTVTISVPTA